MACVLPIAITFRLAACRGSRAATTGAPALSARVGVGSVFAMGGGTNCVGAKCPGGSSVVGSGMYCAACGADAGVYCIGGVEGAIVACLSSSLMLSNSCLTVAMLAGPLS